MATPPCSADCTAGDPSCCEGNICIQYVNACTTDADCGEAGVCVAGPVCYPWCPPGEPSCCFGNSCRIDPCKLPSPAGCYQTGCPEGERCEVTAECIPTSCTCTPESGWQCTGDCVGGACVPSACVGSNPQGCKETGCPEGQTCVIGTACIPSSCTCNEALGAWECSGDCGGGLCQPL